MKVNGINLRQVLSMYDNNKARPEKTASKSDKLDIGDLYKHVEDIKKVELSPDPRVEEIKAGLKNGTYNVPTDKVAQKMIDDVILFMENKRSVSR